MSLAKMSLAIIMFEKMSFVQMSLAKMSRLRQMIRSAQTFVASFPSFV